ncbi:MAG: UDP-2,3-diacylglucosamine diphosphatase [Paracoccus sp. (in: a-proteobacteria)]|uniref:UDP-2,3-diacylglucosamine diphosphatase n=1 Tax=Paracoccus sp. TaxID=267 RepID=UPI0026DEAA44|nr:UDP-2,3-diacylglucosamine diphosphatase [Paracoccus sp. (in: a-proteobacteria)]MDO5631763.1 UDP-2,3-diacylglucosamine diphosphatase [Paracoccus sp. (in: a-proteobacteria)]
MDDGGFDRPATPARSAAHFRTLFLSDLHLGALGCKAGGLLDFLNAHDAETIYLVGDIIDTWRPLGANWPEAHHQVLRLLTRRAQAGRRVVYIPGNHDAFFRHHTGTTMLGFDILPHDTHRTADGVRLLVTHGDCCDIFSDRLSMLSKAGSWLEAGIRRLGHGINVVRERLGRDGWDGLESALARFNRLIRSGDRFQDRLTDMARARGFDGIVCGHFHKPALHRNHDMLYVNCGDWIEHCSAVTESFDGTLRLIRWTPRPRPESQTAQAEAVA